MTDTSLDTLCVNTVRTLAMDAVQQANSGHPTPAALVLSRQAVPTLDRTRYAPASGVALGAYVLADPPRGHPEVILIATGSEVSLCVAAYEELTAEGLRERVVAAARETLARARARH
jgi:transketolase